jgi:hypothetical protein
MIERVHDHLLQELNTNTRTDTVFVLTAILLNLLTLGVNSGVASGDSSGTQTVVMFALASLLIVVNLVAEIGLIRGRQSRAKIINGLLKMYKDQGVDGYYDPTLLGDYRTRYSLFILAVLCTGLVGLIIPFVVWAL